jgi:hypothetical protein
MDHQGATRQSCVCYIANEGYLFQTLTSALQAKRLAANTFDIVLVNLTANPTSETDIVSEICEKNDIILITTAPTFLEKLPFVYSRMFIDEFLPEHYTDILYMDGDTQIIQDITPLLQMKLRPGFICGARDPMVFLNKAEALPNNLKTEMMITSMPEYYGLIVPHGRPYPTKRSLLNTDRPQSRRSKIRLLLTRLHSIE